MFGTLSKCLEPEDSTLKLRKTVSNFESTPCSLLLSQLPTLKTSDKSSTSKELLFTPKKNKNSETKSISREGTSDSVNLTPLSNTTPYQDSRTYAYERLYHLHALNRAEAGKCRNTDFEGEQSFSELLLKGENDFVEEGAATEDQIDQFIGHLRVAGKIELDRKENPFEGEKNPFLGSEVLEDADQPQDAGSNACALDSVPKSPDSNDKNNDQNRPSLDYYVTRASTGSILRTRLNSTTGAAGPDTAKQYSNVVERTSIELYKQHVSETFQAISYVKTLTLPNLPEEKKVYLDMPKRNVRKTVVFDLDETLVHCVDTQSIATADVVLTVNFPSGNVVEAGINIRPYSLECLKEVSKHYEVIVFTASHKCYADVILNYLDPDRELIDHRLYRDNCMQTEEGIYIKDLRILANRDLCNVLLVDNAAYSFGYQLDNGVPIIPFYEDKNDTELYMLTTYLKGIRNASDVRKCNRRAFKLYEVFECDVDNYIDYYLFDDNLQQEYEEASNVESSQDSNVNSANGDSVPTESTEATPSLRKALFRSRSMSCDVENNLDKFQEAFENFVRRKSSTVKENPRSLKKSP